MEGSNKLTFSNNQKEDSYGNDDVIKYGEVINTNDPLGLDRIQVWIKGSSINGGDDEKVVNDTSKLPWCSPFLPKHINIIPKVGEAVLIMVFSPNNKNINRLYIGPIISQKDKLNFDSARTTSLAGFSFGSINPNQNIENIPSLRGIFPNKKDISIQGRYNTDITQKENKIEIRVGKFLTTNVTELNPYGIKFNDVSQGYIQIINNVKIPKILINQNTENLGTVTNIVSNKINLLTHNGIKNFNLNEIDSLISETVLTDILKNGYKIPYGDLLLEYLILLKNAFLSHVHRGNGLTPTDLTISGNKQSVEEFKRNATRLENIMLSENIRIN